MLSSGLSIRISRTMMDSSHLLKPATISGLAEEERQTPTGALNITSQCALQADDGLMRSRGEAMEDCRQLNQMF